MQTSDQPGKETEFYSHISAPQYTPTRQKPTLALSKSKHYLGIFLIPLL